MAVVEQVANETLRPNKSLPIIKKIEALPVNFDPVKSQVQSSPVIDQGKINSNEIVELSFKEGVRIIRRADPKEKEEEETIEVVDAEPEGPTPEEILEEAKKFREEARALGAKAKEEGLRIIALAQTKAKKLIEESKLYCQSIETTAGREGFEMGKEEGRHAGYEEVANLVEETRKTLRQAFGERDRLIKSVEAEAAKLALKIAGRIIGSESKMRSDIVLEMIRTTLEKVKDREHVTIYVHKEDLEYVKENSAIFARMVEGIKNFEIQGDPRVDRGGCIIETNLGSVDARISTKLAAIEAAFNSVGASLEEGLEGESNVKY